MAEHHPAAGVEQPPQQRCGDGEGRVGHDVEGPTGKAQVGRVDLDDDDVGAEPLSQVPCALRVRLDRDHPRPDGEQRGHQRAGAGTDVEDQRPSTDRRVGDEALSPAGAEPVPSPPP